jgi:L-asparaginase II
MERDQRATGWSTRSENRLARGGAPRPSTQATLLRFGTSHSRLNSDYEPRSTRRPHCDVPTGVTHVPASHSLTVVECTRGGRRESVHPFSAVMVDGGEVRWSTGPDLGTYWRSASKPFQLTTALECLGTSADDLPEEAIAIGAASHSAQPEHVALVEKLLRRFGLDEGQLQCGAHPPMHEATAKALATATPIHNNCSGKHTFMLAACKAMEWPLDYRPLTHPLQVRNHARLNELGRRVHEVAIDGCSVPTFFAPLSAMARAWSALAEAIEQPNSTLGRVGRAMHRQPFFVSGTDRLDLTVTTRASEVLAVKIGAEGLFCIARPTRKQGVAVKVHSGNPDVLAVAVKHVLSELGVTLSGDWGWSVVKNVRGVDVGERRVVAA